MGTRVVRVGGWLLLVAVAVLASSSSALAFVPNAGGPASPTWAGGDAGPGFSLADNWVGNSAPSGAVDTLDFPYLSSCSGTTCYAASDDVSGLSATAIDVDSDGNYAIGGTQAISLSGGLDISPFSGMPVSSPSVSLTDPLTLTGTQNWTVDAATSGEPITLGSVTGIGEGVTATLTDDPLLALPSDVEVGELSFSGSGTVQPSSLNATSGSQVSFSGGATLSVPSGSAQTGPLSFSGGTLALSVVAPGTIAGTDYSQLTTSGDLTLSGSDYLTLNLGASGSPCPAITPGEVLTLVSTTGTISGAFANAADGSTITLNPECGSQDAYVQATIAYTTNTITATVPQDSTSVSGTCNPSQVTTGTSTTCTATVTDESANGSAPGGTVTFTAPGGSGSFGAGGSSCALAASSATTATCHVTFTPTSSSVSPDQLGVTYNGDTSHVGSRGSAELYVTDGTTTQLSCQPGSVAAGAGVTCTATVTDTAASPSVPAGQVEFAFPAKWSQTRACTLQATGAASASCQIAAIAANGGTFTITAGYGGANNLAPSSGEAKVTVTGGSGSGHFSGPPGTQCADPYSAASNPANRLMLPQTPPASDQLRGANFFVNGPAHGFAASAIARLLGIDSNTPVDAVLPDVPETESWATFEATIPALEAKLGNNPKIDQEVALLEKIAAEPETQRLSSFSQGGGPGALYKQTQKLFCHNFLADPGAIPMISTYFLHPVLKGCASAKQIRAYIPVFHRRVTEVAEGTGNRPAVFLVETDAIGSSSCMAKRGDFGLWLAQLKWEADKLMSLPHTLVYVEGGYSDANSVAYTARALRKVGINKLSGFWTNDTHLNWTLHEIKWATKVSRKAYGAHFVINTAQNGHGPLLNKHPVTQGVEDLCNAPGRGLGPQPSTDTGYPRVDAFVWSSTPGISGGSCYGGPASGTFWLARALQLAASANAQLGPAGPSRPY